jgi:hypothetical protein
MFGSMVVRSAQGPSSLGLGHQSIQVNYFILNSLELKRLFHLNMNRSFEFGLVNLLGYLNG